MPRGRHGKKPKKKKNKLDICERIHFGDVVSSILSFPVFLFFFIFATVMFLVVWIWKYFELGFKGENMFSYDPFEDYNKDKRLRYKK